MQIMPETWSDLRFRYGLGGDPFDPHDNILAGAAYLGELHDRYGDAGFWAAYSAGSARYEARLATGQPLPDETRAYVSRLAPLTAVDRAVDCAVPAVALRSWSEAPLFAMHADGSPTASWLPPAVQYERRSAAAPGDRFDGSRTAIGRPVRPNVSSESFAMSAVALGRSVACFVAGLAVIRRKRWKPTNGRQDKSAAFGRAHVVGRVGLFGRSGDTPCCRFMHNSPRFQRPERHRLRSPEKTPR